MKPSTAVYELSKDYNLDCSLFERMINNGMYCPILRVQHRMRPEISSLIAPSIYNNLQDHKSVQQYESIKGVRKNVFFIDHTSPESSVSWELPHIRFIRHCTQACTNNKFKVTLENLSFRLFFRTVRRKLPHNVSIIGNNSKNHHNACVEAKHFSQLLFI